MSVLETEVLYTSSNARLLLADPQKILENPIFAMHQCHAFPLSGYVPDTKRPGFQAAWALVF